MTCPSCGATIPDTAQFCHKCGSRLGATAASGGGWRAGVPWSLGGFVVGALVGVLAGGAIHRPPAPVAGEEAAAAPPAMPAVSGGGAAAVDIASMTPDERARRLYTRVMSLHAAGKTDSAEFFLPMALQAYAMLPDRNADAHYHIGVLELASGNLPGALAEADTIARLVPTHLFADMLRARVYGLRKDTKDYQTACRSYLKHEAAEIAKKRPEYTEHSGAIAAFHEEASGAVTTSGGTRG
ncbi:MAG TPA: zinc-ribbon domain-containing protein [Gemmatimonadales bacterium]|nr:zinc-ribbon domain-containing protein [Gemmatimonadales bacterium]